MRRATASALRINGSRRHSGKNVQIAVNLIIKARLHKQGQALLASTLFYGGPQTQKASLRRLLRLFLWMMLLVAGVGFEPTTFRL